MQNPDIPRKTSPSFEQSLTRITLEESYRFVEENLKEALKITPANVSCHWRISLLPVNSFQTRLPFMSEPQHFCSFITKSKTRIK